MTTTEYDGIQHKFFGDPAAYQTVELQRRLAENRYRQAKELARLVSLAGARVAGVFRAWVLAPAARWHGRRQLYRDLMRLDDRLLLDIGIARYDIPRLVRNAYAPGTAAAATPAAGATIHHLAAGNDGEAESGQTGRRLAA